MGFLQGCFLCVLPRGFRWDFDALDTKGFPESLCHPRPGENGRLLFRPLFVQPVQGHPLTRRRLAGDGTQE